MIGGVKESVVPFCEHDICDGLPLLLRGVDTCGVVRTGMEYEHRTLGSTVQRCNEARKIEANSPRIVIRIQMRFDPDIVEDGVVIGCIVRYWEVRPRV